MTIYTQYPTQPIVSEHDYLAEHKGQILNAVEHPDRVAQGYRGALIAQKKLGKKGYLLVIYKETSKDDGFIITAIISRKAK